MWLKSGFDRPHVAGMNAMQIYAREALFYSDLQPIVRVTAPVCFGAAYDLESGRGVVLLENLDRPNISFPGCAQPLSVDQVADGLRNLAALHSRSWGQEWLWKYGLQEMFVPGQAQERHFKSYTTEYIQSFLDGPVGEAVPGEIRDAQRTQNALWALMPYYTNRPYCLLHTDPHPGNCYIDDAAGHVGLLDWEPQIGPWAHDVNYWLIGALSVQDRRASERHLLQEYLDQLAGGGVDPGRFDEAWLSYRRFIAYGYWTWLRNPASMQSLTNNAALSARYGAAMADHNVFDILRV
jgi:aminoglycoside phosphotransferase (APT) family kinase protein